MRIFLGAVILLLAAACTKEAGEGGNSSISGKVILEHFNETFTLTDYITDAADYDVFIIYGDDRGYSDKTETNYQGEYSFNYLRPGDYKVYVYSKVNSPEAINGDAPEEEALVNEINLDRAEDLVLEDFTVQDN